MGGVSSPFKIRRLMTEAPDSAPAALLTTAQISAVLKRAPQPRPAY
jgi:hypothetical protein